MWIVRRQGVRSLQRFWHHSPLWFEPYIVATTEPVIWSLHVHVRGFIILIAIVDIRFTTSRFLLVPVGID